MSNPLKKLTTEYLQSLPADELEVVTRQAVGNLTCAKLLLGRCLLAIERNKLAQRLGCSSYLHYAVVLGVAERTARAARLVARRLEDLPLLTEAAENGSVAWTNLRAVLTRATPESESFWLEVAQTRSTRVVERLVRKARPWDDEDGESPTREPERVRFVIDIEHERMALVEKVMVDLSHQEGRVVGFNEALEYMAAEFLAGRSDHQARARLLEEVEKDRLANEEREENARVQAWAAVGAGEEECPGNDAVKLVVAEDWRNPRLRFNEEARLATPAQKQELMRRDGYRCSTPGCCHRLWLQVHHVAFYCEDGKTVPENLILVCSRCHAHIHMGLLRVTGRAPDGLKWFDAKGRCLNEMEPLEGAPALRGWMARAGQSGESG